MSESANFPIVDQLLEASSNQERAGMLLRLSDGLVHERGAEISAACRALQFAAGEAFITHRQVALLAVRDAHGLLPYRVGHELERWREAMSRYAASAPAAEAPALDLANALNGATQWGGSD